MSAPSCSRSARMRPYRIVQELYEKKLVTYPRTDARVLSTAVSKEIYKNISGLRNYTCDRQLPQKKSFRWEATRQSRRQDMSMTSRSQTIMRSFRQVRAYALNSLPLTSQRVYETIVRRFSVYFLSACSLSESQPGDNDAGEKFFSSFKVLQEEGYLKVCRRILVRKKIPGKRKRAEGYRKK